MMADNDHTKRTAFGLLIMFAIYSFLVVIFTWAFLK